MNNGQLNKYRLYIHIHEKRRYFLNIFNVFFYFKKLYLSYDVILKLTTIF